MPVWIIALMSLVLTVVAGMFGYVLAQDRRVTRLEERVASLGRQLISLPKRKTD